MAQWKRQPQECKGKYRFNGQIYITANIRKELTDEEIAGIILDTQRFSIAEDGIDYLQVYKDETGRKIFFIDQLDDKMKPEHPPEHNHATLLFAWEY